MFSRNCTNYKLPSRVLCTLRIVFEGVESPVEGGPTEQLCEAYKSATIALAVIAIISVVINVLLIIYLLRKTPRKGWCFNIAV